ncbi:hypothetical protein EVC04_227 [Rhizobium phage RHph_I1_9]|uniref:Uncharacterized protein n=1 Tax=Rhizobium phage RHph_I1_9 TaxID=2509729 RepID=A0A7S5RJJ9_9CAUD|nr:hypothetical protein PP936_gp227 [Rhizobium phage RHph_I1_9]QIG73664.1 hypothetical protein EVC04_227 [Rhizobium phage RHph_I1_9]
MNQLQAARDTIELARSFGMHEYPYHGDLDDTIQFPHLEDMLRRMEEMGDKSEAKLGRWLGWMQCAVVVTTPATLEDMKVINVRNADDNKNEEWEYYTSSHSSTKDALNIVLADWMVDESICKNGIIEFPTHTERQWKRRKKRNV